ncbi:MAG: 2-C-methyl-D-erythritol 2,4-cyclodiphosphate synthase [Elusimicrobia bacterium]|nr:2-C-methyl-D-erythritol 2,4-cyclodiphosphate synthase [Elusimicrobiota bacterium]
MLVGIGYDAHRFKKGRKLILGGIEIKYSLGLFGHSDADVLVHSIMDSLLGAAGMDDIGHLFPNDDLRYKNISSIILLKKVIEKLKSKKFKIKNIDSVIIAEKPKISPFILQMKKVLSKALSLPKERIGIKATTNEGMDFIGRGEGIASISIALIGKK